tara:strand:+ start:1802 stop:2047 length:246 start_codon:yes stop_codon:yes gene_type:complete
MSYNGWHNYETWRVMLEIFDGYEVDTKVDQEYVKDFVEELLLSEDNGNSLVESYAMAFVDNVKWYEIVEAVNKYNEERFDE